MSFYSQIERESNPYRAVQNETKLEECMTKILLEYSQAPDQIPPFSHSVSLRNDLAIESLSLVSVLLRIGDALGVDLVESGFELGRLETFGDLVTLAKTLQAAVEP